MKKIIISAMILALMVMATAVLAAPGENSPWVYWYALNEEGNPVEIPVLCDHPSGSSGYLYVNTNTGMVHCFKI